jgi:hypothetical protein
VLFSLSSCCLQAATVAAVSSVSARRRCLRGAVATGKATWASPTHRSPPTRGGAQSAELDSLLFARRLPSFLCVFCSCVPAACPSPCPAVPLCALVPTRPLGTRATGGKNGRPRPQVARAASCVRGFQPHSEGSTSHTVQRLRAPAPCGSSGTTAVAARQVRGRRGQRQSTGARAPGPGHRVSGWRAGWTARRRARWNVS